jgi:hypothetical protein
MSGRPIQKPKANDLGDGLAIDFAPIANPTPQWRCCGPRRLSSTFPLTSIN